MESLSKLIEQYKETFEINNYLDNRSLFRITDNCTGDDSYYENATGLEI